MIELVVLIMVLAIGMAGILLVFQNAVRGSADPQVQKQALAVAEGLLDEILLASYDVQPGTGTRADFDDVDDYNGYATAGGMVDIFGAPVAGLSAYNVQNVTVSVVALNGVAEAKRVTVTVTAPEVVMVVEGYRLRYDGP